MIWNAEEIAAALGVDVEFIVFSSGSKLLFSSGLTRVSGAISGDPRVKPEGNNVYEVVVNASGISIDSRTLEKGDLFIALRGDNFDGHDYVSDAFDKGAVAAIVEYIPDNKNCHPALVAGSRYLSGKHSEIPLELTKANSGNDGEPRFILVKNTYDALEKLAVYRRNQSNAKIIAVTGSVGKTTVKEALSKVLSNEGKVHKTSGNFNNHIGLPLSMSRMPRDTEFGIFELGMNHAGELSRLTKLLKPHIAIITAVEAVHIEFFESVEEIAYAKAEIFEGLEYGGTAVIPFDSPYCDLLKNVAAQHGVKDILTFGGNPLTLPLSQRERGRKRHHAANSLAILAVVKALGCDVEKATEILRNITPPAGRGKVHNIQGVTIIDNSYNASPVSMRAALATLGGYDGRKIALLGDMLELGKDTEKYHRDLVKDIRKNNIDKVFTAGSFMSNLYDDLPPEVRGGSFKNYKKLLSAIRPILQKGDVILVKGSHGSNMWKLVEEIIR